MSGKLWTPEETEFLRDCYAELGAIRCAHELKRSFFSVWEKASYLRLTHGATWSFGRAEHSTLYSPPQLDALDVIGVTYTLKNVSWSVACELRELVKQDRIDEALAALEAEQAMTRALQEVAA